MTEIDQFLQQVHDAIDSGNKFVLEHRCKYISTLMQLGITIEEMWKDIYALTSADPWRKDKDTDPRYPGFVWVTKKFLHGKLLYIKLKIKDEPAGQLLVMSYHIDNIKKYKI